MMNFDDIKYIYSWHCIKWIRLDYDSASGNYSNWWDKESYSRLSLPVGIGTKGSYSGLRVTVRTEAGKVILA